MSSTRLYFEDCHIGDRLVTGGRTITETDVVMFAAFSGDWNPLHTNTEFARNGPHGERVAHGMLSLVAGLNLLFRDGGFGNGLLPQSIVALTELERVKFKRPVRIGDTLRLSCEIVAMVRLFAQRGRLDVRFDILNQGDEVALTGRFSVVSECREAGPRGPVPAHA